MKYVYVVEERGHWDFEECGHIEIYDTFEKALKRYEQLVKNAKEDMAQWLDDDEKEEINNINKEEECASFEIYKEEWYNEFSDLINLNKKEVK